MSIREVSDTIVLQICPKFHREDEIRVKSDNGIYAYFNLVTIPILPSQTSCNPSNCSDKTVLEIRGALDQKIMEMKPIFHRFISEIFMLDYSGPDTITIQNQPEAFHSKCQTEPIQILNIPSS